MGLKISLGLVSLAFLILTVIHIRNYRHLFPHPKPFLVIGKIYGASTGMPEMRQALHDFVDALNETHRSTNLYAAVGYSLSLVATLISLIVLCVTE